MTVVGGDMHGDQSLHDLLLAHKHDLEEQFKRADAADTGAITKVPWPSSGGRSFSLTVAHSHSNSLSHTRTLPPTRSNRDPAEI